MEQQSRNIDCSAKTTLSYTKQATLVTGINWITVHLLLENEAERNCVYYAPVIAGRGSSASALTMTMRRIASAGHLGGCAGHIRPQSGVSDATADERIRLFPPFITKPDLR